PPVPPLPPVVPAVPPVLVIIIVPAVPPGTSVPPPPWLVEVVPPAPPPPTVGLVVALDPEAPAESNSVASRKQPGQRKMPAESTTRDTGAAGLFRMSWPPRRDDRPKRAGMGAPRSEARGPGRAPRLAASLPRGPGGTSALVLLRGGPFTGPGAAA